MNRFTTPGASLPAACACLLALQLVGCATDKGQPDGDGGAAVEPFVPHRTGTAVVPYSMTSTVALVDPETACTVDSYDVKIVCVERSGRTLASFGREGDGPGEFRVLGRLVRGADGRLGVMEGNVLHVFTPAGVLIMEAALPVPLFRPVVPFGATVTGISPLAIGSVRDFGLNQSAVEIDLETGEILDQWRPGSIPIMECGASARGFPVVAERAERAWVFVGCGGHLAFTHGSGPATVIRAPGYVEGLPSDRDVAWRREELEEFARLLEEMTRFPSTADIAGMTEEYATRAQSYFLARAVERYDSRGRLWVPTARDRDEQSFLDVYAEAAYYGTVVVRDRMMGFDIVGGTLAVLVERGVGPEDADGVPDRAIDWYDVSGLEGGGR